MSTELLERVIYNSAIMQKVRDELAPFIYTAAPILFWGEAGSGMGYYAKAIHEASREGQSILRKPAFELEEDTVKQQFLGIGTRTGWLEDADGGTIFLNRIEDVSLSIQKTLLQILSNQSVDGRMTFSRTKNTETLAVDVRFMFSIAHDLDASIQDGLLFRELVDLIRKRGKVVQLPPLRERKEDIVEIAKNFFEELNEKYKQEVASIDRKAQELLMKYHWPGNIDALQRELASIFSQHSGIMVIAAEHLPEHIVNPKIEKGKYGFKLKSGEQFSGKFQSHFLAVQREKSKIRLNTSDIVEVNRIEDDFIPPRLKHFEFKLKDSSKLAALILDKTITIETAFDPPYQHINPVQELYSVTLL